MTDFTLWLRAQLDEDEQIARALDEHLDGHERPYNLADPTDPARVLVDVDAKRRIIDEHYVATGYDGHSVDADVCGRCAEDDQAGGRAGDPWPCTTLRLLALPHAGRPGYRQEWRPEALAEAIALYLTGE